MDAIKRLQISVLIFLGSEKVKLGNLKRHTVTLVDFLLFLIKFIVKGQINAFKISLTIPLC